MKINIDRLCRLAGIQNSQRQSLNEASNRSWHEDTSLGDEATFRYGNNQLNEENFDMDQGMEFEDEFGSDLQSSFDSHSLYEEDEEEEDDNEMLDIDETMLVQELRRAKHILRESKRKAQRKNRRKNRRSRVNEQKRVRALIEEEVADMLDQYNQNSKWVYGKNQPRNSRKGRIATAFPGIGFRN
jgi:hypothetical protein